MSRIDKPARRRKQGTKGAAGVTASALPRDSQPHEVVSTLVNDSADASHLLELYYWTREPGIVELIRAYLDLPEHTQRNLSAYLLNGRRQSVVSTFDAQGRLILARSGGPQAPRAGLAPRAPAADKQRQTTEV